MCAYLWSFWTERALGQSWGTRRELGLWGYNAQVQGAGSPCTGVGGGVTMHGCRGWGKEATGVGCVQMCGVRSVDQ